MVIVFEYEQSFWFQVQIASSRPISKNKAWVVSEILKKERIFDTSDYAAERAAAQAVSLPLTPKPVVVSACYVGTFSGSRFYWAQKILEVESQGDDGSGCSDIFHSSFCFV